MKRSTQVTLVLVAAAGIGGAAAAMMPDRCRTQPSNSVASDVQQDCRSRGSFFGSGTGGSKSGTSTSPASGSEGAARGGFGSIGHAFASLGG